MLRLHNSKKKALTVTIIAVIIGVLCYICFLGQPATSSTRKLRIGYLPIAASLPLFVSIEQGYFTQEGYEVELAQFRSSNEMAIAGAKGDLDVMVTCATNAVLDAINISGSNIKVFLANGYIKGSENAKTTDYLLALQGESLSTLKGQKIAFFPGSVSRVFAEIVLPKHGLSIGEIEYVEMAPGKWLAALKSSQIKAVVAIEPYATIILESGGVVPLIEGYIADVFDGVPLSGSWFAGDKLSSDDKVKIVDIFANAINTIDNNREQSLATLGTYTKLSAEVYLKMGLNRWGITSAPHVRKSFSDFAQILYEKKAIQILPKDENWLWIPLKSN